MSLNRQVNFDILSAKEIRDVLKSKAHCLRAGFSPNHIIIETLDEFRDHYIQRVGLPTYLSQMLGKLATTEVRHCLLFAEDEQLIPIKGMSTSHQQIQRFIITHFAERKLPFRIEMRPSPEDQRVEVRYL